MSSKPPPRPVALTHLDRSQEEPKQRPLSLPLVMRVLRWTRPYPQLFWVLVAAVALRILQIPLLDWAASKMVNGPIKARDWHGVVLWGAAFLGFLLFTQFTFYWRMRFAQELGERVVRDLRNAVFNHLQAMPMAYFDRTKVGRIISRVSSDCENVRAGVQTVLFVSLVAGGNMLVAAVILASSNWPLFLVVLAASPVLWWVCVGFHGRLSGAHRKIQESYSRMTATTAESVAGIRVTQGFVRQEVNAGLFGELMDEHGENMVNGEKLRASFLPSVELIGQVTMAAILALGAWQMVSGGFFAEYVGGKEGVMKSLILYAFALPAFINPLRIVAQQYNEALTSMAAAERVFTLLDREPSQLDAPDATPIASIQGRVTFENVDFAYRPDTPVLRGVSFEVAPGQTVALVGHTGSGKTTIANLLLKFYLPTSGAVRVDGRDTRGVLGSSLAAQVAVVTQNNFLFTGTVVDNIRLARPGASEAQVKAAAETLGVLDMLEALPDGFNTQVGEKGHSLSLGQRQVICFCRAMLTDPRLLILDEATASVDTLTEARLQEALKRLLKGRTSFLIAHRLSTIREADVILVMDHGQLVERGSHAQLLEKNGHYAQLHRRFVG